MRVLQGLFLALSLMACNRSAPNVQTCEFNSDCEALHRCSAESICEPVECTTKEDCGHSMFCDADYSCKVGCSDNTDCMAGQECTEQHICEDYGCRTTELDCQYGEFCNTSSGECYLDNQPHCQTCDIMDVFSTNQCGATGECFYSGGQTCNTAADCPSGYSCDYLDGFTKQCHQDMCLMQCNPADANACPRGFTCGDVGNGLGAFCYADCSFLKGEGWL